MNIDPQALAALIGGPWGMLIVGALILFGPKLATYFPRLGVLLSRLKSPAPAKPADPVPLIPAPFLDESERPALEFLRILLGRKGQTFGKWVHEKAVEEASKAAISRAHPAPDPK